jgi:NADPH:quinone reductase-like Zn-dependent oxidoreductase
MVLIIMRTVPPRPSAPWQLAQDMLDWRMRYMPGILIMGASSGIGETVAGLIAKHDYRVALAARRCA